MRNVSQLCEAVCQLLSSLNCTSVPSLQDNWEHIVCGEMVCVWEFLLKYCRPRCEIFDVQKILAKMTKQQEVESYKKKVHLRKILARKKKLNCRSERDIINLVTKHCCADREIIDSWKVNREIENKVFLLHCKALEVERELKLCNENCKSISRYIHKQETGSLELSPLDDLAEAMDQVKSAVTEEKDKFVNIGLYEDIGQMLCRNSDAVSLWHAVFSQLDQVCQQVEQMNEDSDSQAVISDDSCGMETSDIRLQLVELTEKVATMESDVYAQFDGICMLKIVSAKTLKNWFLVRHPSGSQSFSSAVEDFVELSVRHKQLTSIKNHYLSMENKFRENAHSLMILDMNAFIKQKEDLLHKNVKCQKQLNDVLAHCFGLLFDVRWGIYNNSVELSDYLSSGMDLATLGRLAEEVPGLWTRELEMFVAFPLQTLNGLNLSSRLPASRLICPVTLRTCNSVGYFSEKMMTFYSSMLLLPPEATVIQLAKVLESKTKWKMNGRCVNKLTTSDIPKLKVEEENILSTASEKLEYICQCLAALVNSFEENEKNLLFWVSQPLGSVAKTMVVNGRTFEEFQQVRNMSSLYKSSSVHSGLNKLKSFQISFRKRTDSM